VGALGISVRSRFTCLTSSHKVGLMGLGKGGCARNPSDLARFQDTISLASDLRSCSCTQKMMISAAVPSGVQDWIRESWVSMHLQHACKLIHIEPYIERRRTSIVQNLFRTLILRCDIFFAYMFKTDFSDGHGICI